MAGALALRIGAVDPGIIQLILDETWAAHAALADLPVERSFEVVDGAAPPWQPGTSAIAGDDDDEPPPAPRANAVGGTLPEVAARLGLPLADLVIMLSARGLLDGDEAIDAGTEETVRALLGEARPGAHLADERSDDAPPAAAPNEGAPLGARGLSLIHI